MRQKGVKARILDELINLFDEPPFTFIKKWARNVDVWLC
jgi:hypothetical protein